MVIPTTWNRMRAVWASMPLTNGWAAIVCLHLAVVLAGLESIYVQRVTTGLSLAPDLTSDPLARGPFLLLCALDFLVPLSIALLSRRVLFLYMAGQTFLSTILLHYDIFFYNPLTLSTIYHSMQGAASLGIDIFGFARVEIIAAMAAVFVVKVCLVQLSRAPDWAMPRFWSGRGATSVACMTVICCVSVAIYGQTGLSVLWVDSRGHRTATERRLEAGTREAVRSIGYVATWIGEWMSGTYKDTDLIYAEMRCADPGYGQCGGNEPEWDGLPLPRTGDSVALVQVESLDFAAVGMRVNGHDVVPFLTKLAGESLFLQVFAPHKVGSSNSDYEILNGRIADQNVIYYTYIHEYPDSLIHLLNNAGYETSLFHGLGGDLFNLRSAYTAQGFNRLVFKDELLAEGYTPSKYIMNHVLDEDVFNAAAERLGGRQAQFVITMSSHVPFMEPLGIFQSAGGTFARYVSSLHYLDQCLASYYARLPEGAVLILWGDHGSDVTYPRGFPENGRHVPFLVHVKGDADWLLKPEAAKTSGWPVPTTDRVYGLCELAHYLRCVFRASAKPDLPIGAVVNPDVQGEQRAGGS